MTNTELLTFVNNTQALCSPIYRVLKTSWLRRDTDTGVRHYRERSAAARERERDTYIYMYWTEQRERYRDRDRERGRERVIETWRGRERYT